MQALEVTCAIVKRRHLSATVVIRIDQATDLPDMFMWDDAIYGFYGPSDLTVTLKIYDDGIPHYNRSGRKLIGAVAFSRLDRAAQASSEQYSRFIITPATAQRIVDHLRTEPITALN